MKIETDFVLKINFGGSSFNSIYQIFFKKVYEEFLIIINNHTSFSSELDDKLILFLPRRKDW